MPMRGSAARSICPSGSSGSSRSSSGAAKASPNASANSSVSACEEHSAARSAKDASSRREASTAPSARCAASSSPTPTLAPPARMSAASRESEFVKAPPPGAGSAAPAERDGPGVRSRTVQHSRVADAVDVLAHLERDAEGVLERLVGPERDERAGPRDRFPHSGQLVELLPAQPRDGVAHPQRDRLGHVGQARADDVGLAGRVGIVDPVVEAAALERVVELAGAEIGQYDEWPRARADRA